MLRLTVRKLQTVHTVRQSGKCALSTAAPVVNNAAAGIVDATKAFFVEHQVTIKGVHPDLYAPLANFVDSPFVSKIQTVLKKETFDKPSPIQALSWPIALDKKDIISVAKTGSGKTLGFLLPGFQNILVNSANQPRNNHDDRRRPAYKSPQVLVLAPTRELSNQIATEAYKYHTAGVSTVSLYGGAPKGAQIASLRQGADCVVATPGRCNDLIDEGVFDISKIKYLVLDEADRMLDMGFEPQIRQIIDQLPTAAQGRQTLFFTATWPREVQALAAEFLTNPIQINIGNQDTLNANKDIKQHIMQVKGYMKNDALLDLLEQKINFTGNPRSVPKTIIFCATKAGCDDLQGELRRAGYNAAALHGDKSQAIRDEVMNSFRRGRVNVLIATDIAARGLDVKDIENVINFDFPNNTEDYVHRIGRTARAGATGSSFTFLSSKDLENRRNMSDLVGVLTRCEQEIPAVLENYKAGRAQHSKERDRFDSFNSNRAPSRNSSPFGGRGDRNSSFGRSGSGGGRGAGVSDLFGRDSFQQFDRDGGFGGGRSSGGRDSSRFGSYGSNSGSGGARSGNTSRFSDERFERAPRSTSTGSGSGAMADPFNGYGNGLGNYNERRSSPREWGNSSGSAGAGAGAGAGGFNSNNKYANSKAKYESFDFEADDFDAIDVARRAASFRKSN